MNQVLFQCKYFKVKVRGVLISLLILGLLFYGLSIHEKKKIEKQEEEIIRQKEIMIENVCTFTTEDINDFYRLFQRTDLCSTEWFQDLDDYIARIEEQNKYLSRNDKEQCKEVLAYQRRFLGNLKAFKKDQKETNINELQQSFRDYKKYYDENCGGNR